MRLLIAAGFLAIAACTTQPEAPPAAPDTRAQMAETQALLSTPNGPLDHGPIAGYVTSRDGQTLSLDSGGAHLIPLQISPQTPAMIDGQKSSSDEIRQGDVVRASYKMGADGAPHALELVVTSKPVSGIQTPLSVIPPPKPQPPQKQ
jgi:hypothetical protein